MAAKKARLKEGTQVEVAWLDIASYSGWMPVERAKGATPIVMKSIGYVVEDAKDALRIAMTREQEPDGKVTEILVIPRGNVLKTKKI